MGAKVDRYLTALEGKGFSKASAIRIGKSRGVIKQKGRHLVSGGARVKRKSSK